MPKFNLLNISRRIAFYKVFLLGAFPLLSRRPRYVVVHVNDRCNSRCNTCFIWKSDVKDISKNFILDFLETSLRYCGRVPVTFTGGEPLLRRDIYEMISFTQQQRGLPRIITNGLLLSSSNIDKLSRSGIESITISLNGVNEQIHDSSRGIPGNLRRIRKAVQYIKKKHRHIMLDFLMTIYKDNLKQIIPVIEFAHKNNATVGFQPLQEFFKWKLQFSSEQEARKSFTSMLPTNKLQVKKVFNQVRKLKSRGYKIRVFESHLKEYENYFQNPHSNIENKRNKNLKKLILMNDGEVKLCYSLPSIGNLYKQNAKDIITKTKINHIYTDQEKKECTLCNLTPTSGDILRSVYELSKNKLKINKEFINS